jgi:hypothetical protein
MLVIQYIARKNIEFLFGKGRSCGADAVALDVLIAGTILKKPNGLTVRPDENR